MIAKNKEVKKNERAESNTKELERKLEEVVLDKRGVPSGVAAGADNGEQKLIEIVSKRRVEQMMQKKCFLSQDKFELQLTYKSEEIADIREEITMLDSDEEDAKKTLKVQIQWTSNEEQDAVTELTAPTSNDDLKAPTIKNVPSNSNKGAAEVSLSTALFLKY